MSGHSHFKTIKAQKAISDAKRGNLFSKMGRLITIAAKNGPDPITNSRLKVTIEQAKIVNMPKDNIERAIERGTGELAGENLEEVIFEGFGPGGIAVIIEGITDNKNRTLGEIKQILNQNGGKLAGEGAVQWMFDKKGVITVDNKDKKLSKEQIELQAIESGAEDIYWHEEELDICTKPEDLESVKKNLEERGLKSESAGFSLVPKDSISVDEKTKQACQKLFETLDENDAVQEIYSNLRD